MTLSADDHDRELVADPLVYRLGRRTPCCDRIVRHVDADRILCRGCGTLYRDVSAGVLAAFPGTADLTGTHTKESR